MRLTVLIAVASAVLVAAAPVSPAAALCSTTLTIPLDETPEQGAGGHSDLRPSFPSGFASSRPAE